MNIGKPNRAFNGGFIKYVWAQKKLIAAWLLASAVLFVLLKILFPYPDFFFDSFTYVQEAATESHGFGFRPQGYPEFLYLLHILYPSAGLVVLIQYLLFTSSTLFFVLSSRYLYSVSTRQNNWLLGLTLLNPMLLFIANLVSSDSLFCSLTVLWFTSLLWIVRKPGWVNIVVHILLLFACLHTRYIALFYFAISITAFIVANGTWFFRISGIAMSILVVYGYVAWQEHKIEDQFQVQTFSGFANWQVANNVLCYYKKLDVAPSDLPTEETKMIDLYVKRWIDSSYKDGQLGTEYMWDKKSPLKIYTTMKGRVEHEKYFYEWIRCSKDIGDYGRTLIKNNPTAYVKYFMIPNFRNFLVPDLEALGNYNYYNLTVTRECMDWYQLDTDFLSCRVLHLEEKLMFLFPYLNGLLNLLNIGFIFFFLSRNLKRWKSLGKDVRALFVVWTCFYLGYMFFSIASAYVVFRYLDVVFILGVVIPVILYPYALKNIAPTENEKDGDPKAAIRNS